MEEDEEEINGRRNSNTNNNNKSKSLKKLKSASSNNDGEEQTQHHHVFIIGEKVKSQVAKDIPSHIEMIYSGIGGKKQSGPSFYEVCLICDDINYVMQENLLNSDIVEDDSYDEVFDSGFILYNNYINSVSYEISTLPIYSRETIVNSRKFFFFFFYFANLK